MKNIFLGIDPGVAITGYGVLQENGNKFETLSYGCIRTEKSMAFDERLKYIYQDLNIIIREYKPNYFCIEELFFCNNVRTALKVGQARGVMLLTAIQAKLPIYEFTPLQVKQAICGYGKADKRQIQQMVQTLLNLDELPKPDDAADALAVAYCGAASYKMLGHHNEKNINNNFC